MKRFMLIIVLLLSLLLLSGCFEPTRKAMMERYSDDENYVTLCGKVLSIDVYNVDKRMIVVECDELKTYIPYQVNPCEYYVYSTNIINLNVGDAIAFKTVPFHFYNGHQLPIVEVIVNNEVLLDFDEGKQNLISWVKTIK